MIAVDWGTSSFRAFRLDACGVVIEQRRAALGVLACKGRFEAVLQEQIAGWDDELIVLAGMIGGRQGWVEMPYVSVPAAAADIAAAMLRIDATGLRGRNVWTVPGLLHRGLTPNSADVMRGEETQLCGLLEHEDSTRLLVCLPGTHSKWAVVEQARIGSFFTAMTGELFDLLRTHSLLASLMTKENSAIDHAAFIQGIARAGEPGGLLHHLFSVRTSGLLGSLQTRQLSSYLSGLLIAHELLDSQWRQQMQGQTVHLIGGPALLEAYSLALRQLKIAVKLHDETLAASGMHVLARHRGLLSSTASAF